MLSVYEEKQECCGCGACSLLCPEKCITMVADKTGASYPEIEQSKCVDCGLCKKSCVFQNGYSFDTDEPDVYAVKHRDRAVRANSTSGGLFTALSDIVLERGGVVFGCAMCEDHVARHICAKTKAQRDKLCGSKYVQSELGGTFSSVREYLENGRFVMFTGTPCQTAALRGYLNAQKAGCEKLYAVDFICHGTPSPLMLKLYIDFIEKKKQRKLIRHNFRTKHGGWGFHIESNVYENKHTDYMSLESQLYKNLFYANLNLNLNCYNCKYTSFARPSDLTIADFWGIQEAMPDFYDSLGVSLLLVNSQKGRELFQAAKDRVEFRPSSKAACSKKQLHLTRPNEPNPNREAFMKDLLEYGFEYAAGKYARYNMRGRAVFYVKSILKNVLWKTNTALRRRLRKVMAGRRIKNIVKWK